MDEDNPISKVGREECSGFLCSLGLHSHGREGGLVEPLIGTWDRDLVRVAYARGNFLVRPRRYVSAVIRLINSYD